MLYIHFAMESLYLSVARDPTSKSAHILFEASFCYVAGRFTSLTILLKNGLLSSVMLSPFVPDAFALISIEYTVMHEVKLRKRSFEIWCC